MVNLNLSQYMINVLFQLPNKGLLNNNIETFNELSSSHQCTRPSTKMDLTNTYTPIDMNGRNKIKFVYL